MQSDIVTSHPQAFLVSLKSEKAQKTPSEFQNRRYEETLNAGHFGGHLMIINREAALKLIEKYFDQ